MPGPIPRQSPVKVVVKFVRFRQLKGWIPHMDMLGSSCVTLGAARLGGDRPSGPISHTVRTQPQEGVWPPAACAIESDAECDVRRCRRRLTVNQGQPQGEHGHFQRIQARPRMRMAYVAKAVLKQGSQPVVPQACSLSACGKGGRRVSSRAGHSGGASPPAVLQLFTLLLPAFPFPTLAIICPLTVLSCLPVNRWLPRAGTVAVRGPWNH